MISSILNRSKRFASYFSGKPSIAEGLFDNLPDSGIWISAEMKPEGIPNGELARLRGKKDSIRLLTNLGSFCKIETRKLPKLQINDWIRVTVWARPDRISFWRGGDISAGKNIEYKTFEGPFSVVIGSGYTGYIRQLAIGTGNPSEVHNTNIISGKNILHYWPLESNEKNQKGVNMIDGPIFDVIFKEKN